MATIGKMNGFSRRNKRIGVIAALSVSGLLLSSCADVTISADFYEDEETDSLVYDFSWNAEYETRYLDSLAALEGNEDMDSEEACLVVDEMLADYENSQFDPLLAADLIDGASYSVSATERSNTITCHFTIREIPLGTDISDHGFFGGIDAWHDEEEGVIYVDLNTETESETFIDFIQQDPESVLPESTFEFDFEFPDDVIYHDTGQLIAEREYSGGIDRNRIANQEVASSNIVHITSNELSENNGFEIAAADGMETDWLQIIIFSIVGFLVVVGAVISLILTVRGIRRQQRRRIKHKVEDLHEITLDNPNPYKNAGHSSYNKKKKGKGLAGGFDTKKNVAQIDDWFDKDAFEEEEEDKSKNRRSISTDSVNENKSKQKADIILRDFSQEEAEDKKESKNDNAGSYSSNFFEEGENQPEEENRPSRTRKEIRRDSESLSSSDFLGEENN